MRAAGAAVERAFTRPPWDAARRRATQLPAVSHPTAFLRASTEVERSTTRVSLHDAMRLQRYQGPGLGMAVPVAMPVVPGRRLPLQF